MSLFKSTTICTSFALIVLIIIFLGGCTLFAQREYDLGEPFVDAIAPGIGILKTVTNSAEFILEGHFSGSGSLFFLHVDPSYLDMNTIHKISTRIDIEGDIQRRFVKMWYSTSVWVKFFPIKQGTGTIRVRFRLGTGMRLS